MQRTMLQAKLHRVKTTQTEVGYEGSVAIDTALLAAADIKEFQQIHIYNIDNGERFTSYAVPAEAGSGTIAVLGAAARRVAIGDLLIICTYSDYSEEEVANHDPHMIYVDDNNAITHTHNGVADTLKPVA
ncbi:MAG: aspartate 1-decarboxylase [Arenicella sp.]